MPLFTMTQVYVEVQEMLREDDKGKLLKNDETTLQEDRAKRLLARDNGQSSDNE